MFLDICSIEAQLIFSISMAKVKRLIVVYMFLFSSLILFIFIIFFKYQNNSAVCSFVAATGSSDNHAIFMSNVLYSFAINNPNCVLYCYNLDLNDLMYNKIMADVILSNIYLKKRKRHGRIIFLNYTQNIYTKQLAVFTMSFKPTIVYRLLKKHKKTVIWMDAGVEILTPLIEEVNLAKKYGFYMDRNKHILLDWVHPSALQYFKFSRDMFKELPDTDAGYLTVDYNIDFIKKVIEPWYECAKHRECICPLNFTRKYYRRDQPALSMLIYSNMPYSSYVGIKEINSSHIKQCDHKNGCNCIKNYIKIVKYIFN